MTKASCWKHPAQYQVGVCASCLRERLAQLCIEEHYSSPQRCSFDSNSSSSLVAGAVAAEDNAHNAANPVTISTLIEADQVESEYRNGLPSTGVEEAAPLPKFASFLQRTHSWSSSRQQQNHEKSRSKDLGKTRTLARIISGKDLYGNLSLASSGALMNDEGCKFDFCDTPKRHYKASSWPEIESHKEQRSRGSWIASLFGLRSTAKPSSNSRESKEAKQLKERKRFFGLGRRKKGSGASATSDPVEDISCSPWRSEKLVSDFPQSGEHTQASTPSSFVTNRVMPLSSNGEYNLYSSSKSKPSLTRVTSVNGRTPQKAAGKEYSSSWGKTWSTPLRRFMPSKEESGRKSSSKGEADIDGFGHEDDFKSSWSISSPAELKRFHPSPAFPANSSYTAYYRDYGASWSLHSSPMPGSKGRSWNHNQQRGGGSSRPWESRDGFHAHPSPFHAAGSNTWNFYLTPLRPVRSSTSRHRT